MAAESRWEEVLSSIDRLLIETESQDNNPDLGFHEAALLLNRLEMAVSVLRALFDMDLNLDRNINQVLGQLCSLLTDIYQYWNIKVTQIRRRTVSLPDFGLRETIHSANPGRPPFVIEKNRYLDISDDELDALIRGYFSRHGNTTGESYLIGFIRSRGLRVQRDRIRWSLTRVDPENTALGWACVITRRVYSVPEPNSLGTLRYRNADAA